MTAPRTHFPALLLLLVCGTVLLTGMAHAQSSLGIGTNDAIVPSTGLFGHWMVWINQHQQAFYRSLAAAMKAMREDDSRLWLLVGLSFAYGVFHAAGPGHGKAVISSYMVANEVALRRGIMLSFVSAFLQAATAIAVMLLAYFVLRGTSISMTKAAWSLEIASYVLVTAFGAWLLWRKGAPGLRRLFGASPAYSLSAAGSSASATSGLFGDGPSAHRHSADCVHNRGASLKFRGMPASSGSAAGAMQVCESCGHSHAPDPAALAGDRFDWRTAWSAIVAVGVRPCSGALIVLSFAFLNGLWLGGVLSVLAMAVGTGITVAVLATLAVTAKNWAVAIAGDGRIGNRLHTAIEIGGAAFIFLVGLLLLSASLAA